MIGAALIATTATGASRRPAPSINPANDKLVALPPADRAAMLARAVSHWCIGSETFLMGVERSGAAAGNAYWSLRCADGSAWVVQLSPLGEIVAIDCDSFKQSALGKECFKKF
jgi:hypothetical protein